MKKIIKRIPLLGYFFKLLSAVVFLPIKLRSIEHAIHHDRIEKQALQEKTTISNIRLLELIEEVKNKNHLLEDYAQTISDLRHELSVIKPTSKTLPASSQNNSHTPTFADDHSLDDFYLKFENKFRGEEKTILQRLVVYLPYFKNRDNSLEKLPVLDIGSGRGEFLDLLTSERIKVAGLDLNSEMVKRSKAKGYEITEDDALSYLTSQKKASFSGVCGFHIVEHIPFPELMQLFNECFRVIKKDGIVIFETPNPENLTVGALNFNYDPSHLKPLPPQLLAFCLEHTGFKEVKILPLHPEMDTSNEDPAIDEALKRIFGPRDYAVIAKKP
jgi:2-polyprenyl-3-methyl-5-hydroxy-6-metoxy-1,4-benzoquinol methylase